MQYKTIVHELIQSQKELHDSLKSSKSLLSMIDQLAVEFKNDHLNLLSELQKHYPESTQLQLNTRAFEVAMRQIEETIRTMNETPSTK